MRVEITVDALANTVETMQDGEDHPMTPVLRMDGAARGYKAMLAIVATVPGTTTLTEAAAVRDATVDVLCLGAGTLINMARTLAATLVQHRWFAELVADAASIAALTILEETSKDPASPTLPKPPANPEDGRRWN